MDRGSGMTEQERVDKIAELRETGQSYDLIGQAIGISGSYVCWICLKHGIEGHRKYPLGDKGPMLMRRGNHEVRKFTPEEDATITRMELAGAKRSEIARALKRKPNSILGRLMTLARREERALEGAS